MNIKAMLKPIAIGVIGTPLALIVAGGVLLVADVLYAKWSY